MSIPVGLTSNPLVWVKAEIDRSIAAARRSLAESTVRTADRALLLGACGEQVRQVRGAIQMLALDGLSRFCIAMEQAVNALVGSPPSADPLSVSMVDRALFALTQFVDDLAKGELNVPLKLFPVYRELNELAGRHEVAENELFFPELHVETPLHPSAHTLAPPAFKAHVQACRSLYQRGLLAWLTQPGNRQGLQNMRNALDELDQVAEQMPAPRGLWWAATGLIDALILQEPEALPVQVKPLLGRIERYMRDAASGTAAGGDSLLRELLYPLALSRPVSRRVREVKALHGLDSHLPEFCVSGTLEYDLTHLAPMLEDMRRRLSSIEDCWVQYTSGQGPGLREMREQANGLKAIARDLGHYRVVKLLDVILLIASRLPEPHPRQNEVLALEMAAAFLFMESMLDTFTSPPPDIDQQVAVMVGWLLDAVKPRGKAAPGSGLRDDITQRQNLTHIRSQVAREILANLLQIEQVLDKVARSPADRSEIASLDHCVRQVAGALKMLGFSRANAVLSACEHLMRLCIEGDPSLIAASLEWVADGLSCLGFYLDALQRGQYPSEELLIGFLDRLSQADARAAGTTDWVPAANEGELAEAQPDPQPLFAPAQPPVDLPEPPPAPAISVAVEASATSATIERDAEELLAVYVEEAHEVLAEIGAMLERLHRSHDDAEALSTVRRGFHTLKGSGRMVGLHELGEFAWELEQTLNQWLRDARPATPGLQAVIERAAGAFAGAVAQLEDNAAPVLDGAAQIVALAQALRHGDLPALPTVETTAPAVAPSTTGTPAEVVVGDVRLSESLYGIYLREAATHLQALAGEMAAREREPGRVVSHDLVRAAHTLKSSSRTTGFAPVADLSAMLEELLHLAEGTVLDPEAFAAVCASTHALEEMIARIGRAEAPVPAHAQRRQLQSLVSALASRRPVDVAAAPEFDVSGEAAEPAAQAAPPAPATPTGASLRLPATPPGQRGPVQEPYAEDDLDGQLLPVFFEEAAQLLPQIGADLHAWRSAPVEIAAARSLARALHTLKGSARMAGAMRMGELTHAIESRVGMALESGETGGTLFEELQHDIDRIAERLDALQAARPMPVAASVGPADPAAAPHGGPLAAVASTLRVDADVLDRLVNQAGEVSIARARIEGEMDTFKQSLLDLTDSVGRLRTQLRETQIQADSQMQSRMTEVQRDARQFDPLEFDRYTRLQELTRLMAESLHDVQAIQQTLLANLGETEAALSQQGRVNRDLQHELVRLRSVPLGLLSERLQRTVRQTARQLGKSVALDIAGETLEIDRNVLQRIAAPLEHMLRNAVAHGIETPEARRSRGKPELGRIVLTLQQEGNEHVLAMSDDGGGLDLGRIRREALRLGLIEPGAEIGDAALAQFIFAPGFSTAHELTQTAGRGVGMDVVRAEVSGAGGRVEVTSTSGEGTAFRICLPLTLAASQAILVRAGGATYAIASGLVEQVQEIRPEELTAAYRENGVTWQGASYPLFYLPRLLGQRDRIAEIQRYNVVLLLRSGDNRAAVHLDQIVRNQEIVLKNVGPQLARVPGVAGATVLGNGQVVLIVNPLQLAMRAPATDAEDGDAYTRMVADERPKPLVMVVDDSLTVRRLTSRLVAREGYQVATAKDGVDALQQMQDTTPDLLVLDIEMPRMDGFELTKHLRSDPRTADTPIIIVTSRTADKHRQHAFELGANAYFGKPYQEDELLARIGELLDHETPARAL
jgi:chemosensory pili system protein ChpA (sensor histidine kinase/response regulator)